MGYNGEDFAEKLQKVNVSGILNFSPEEIQSLITTYNELIFQDVDKNSFSAKRNSIITLNNGQSVTTNAYTLNINKNELDKIYKRILTNALENEIILSKIEQIDNKMRRIWL